ncbi:unnamed protein product [Urochloa decumbens]|uniref:NB-ARC domain-containing protein n=1 Tax=Urochloa decumbens TaxID=240449 RepID=A0ABC9CGV9_9POAL
MKDVLVTVSAALDDAEGRSAKEKLAQLLLKRLKDAALDISDLLEDYQDASDQAAANKKPVAFSCLPIAYKKIVVAHRMKNMRDKLRKIKEDFANFNFSSTEVPNTTIVQHYDKHETTSDFLNEVKGRDGENKEIINKLSACNDNDERETVIIPIYALGGMGKTTLAQLVYNNDQFKNYDHRIWVYVSQDFNLLKIGNSIISLLQKGGGQQNGGYNNSNLQVIKQCLDGLLHGKKVLIVLDDLWEEDDTELRKLNNMLHVGRQGSMIDVIVTTRKESIARKVSTSEPYRLHPLDDKICWEMIRISSMVDGKSNQNEFELIGMDLAKKCGGVPLAAEALGRMLQSKDLSEWRKINNNGIWNETSNDPVLSSLMLSYQRMTPQLRICFSYCALFSKGQNIIENDLIHQWIAQDFIEPSKGKEYIKQLLAMSFLHVSKLSSTSKDHVVRYTMRDRVHDLARLTMADELMVFDVTTPERNTCGQKYCRYSLLRKFDRTMKLRNILPRKIRALRFADSDELDIPSDLFSFLKYLRVLNFNECSGILLPDSIGHLKKLRCLIAPRMQNHCLPECITTLSKLQYLILNGSSQISALPISICRLGHLRYLSLSGCYGLLKLPESFADLKCMVHLDMSGCSGISELPDGLDNLTNLMHLDLSGCSTIQAIPESLCGLTQLQCLNLSSCSYLSQLPQSIGCLVDLQYLNMSSCGQIRELTASLMNIQNLLHLDLSHCRVMGSLGCLRGLTALQHIDLSHIPLIGDEEFDGLGNLTNLKYLGLSNCGLFFLRKVGKNVDFIGALTNLEHLDLSENYLISLPESVGTLRRLHTLVLSHCDKLKSLPESIGALELKSLVMEGCSKELMDQASSLVHYSRTLPIFMVRADDDNGCSNLHLLEGAHHASDLRILSLENARSLQEADKVRLSDKHNLSELTLAWSVWYVVRVLEDKDLLGQLVPPRGLKHMRLEGYRSTSFPDWLMGISNHLINLVSIKLSHMPTCTSLPPLGQLPHLEDLCLENLSSVKRISGEFCGGQGAFPRLSNLSIIFMRGLEEWNTTYSVAGDSMEEFMFPVLDHMRISDCPRLRLKPCPPTFREWNILRSDEVISSLEEADKISHYSSPSRQTKLELVIAGNSCGSMRLFHHFPALQELSICHRFMTSLPESMRHLTSLQSLSLLWCEGISELPEWLGDLTSLTILVISGCKSIKSLPPCILQPRFSLSEIKIYRRSWISRINMIYRKYRTKFLKNSNLF